MQLSIIFWTLLNKALKHVILLFAFYKQCQKQLSLTHQKTEAA